MLTLGKAMLAGLIAGLSLSGAAQAQTLYRTAPPVVIASDLEGPYDDDLPPPPPRYAPPPYARAYPAPSPGYGPSSYGALPVHEVYRIVRDNGYSPLGAPVNRGNVITISVFDPDGEDGRLVMDAYSGRILRFVPAYSESGGRILPAVPVAYGPPPTTLPARAAVPLPKPRLAALSPATKPLAAPQIPPAPPAAIAAAQPAPPPPKPSVTIQPTQAMPPVQGAE